MRRLYFQVYLALLGALIAFALLDVLARLMVEGPGGESYTLRHLTLHVLVPVGVVALVLAVVSFPVARRVTGRLERLRVRVEALGGGDLAARVEVEGHDEVAELAASFNGAAERIEELVTAQKRLLAAASHELRSPLARLRMAVELLPAEGRSDRRERVYREIAELDELVGELLLACRLDAMAGPPERQEVDLLGLLAEEAAYDGAEVTGEPVIIPGDPRLLRSLVRNLLDNARRHGGASRVEASVVRLAPAVARLQVADRGPGVAAAERERIFEPFYRPAGAAEGDDGGVGMGLALVRQIARHHGGDARCVPRPGGGTCFEVDLATS